MRLILPHELKSKKNIGYCNEHRRRLEDAGLFPKRVRLGPRGNTGPYAYVEEELDAYLEARAAARELEAAA
jgi:predicted DNA-binding transcriptional regulator AlpA